MLNIKPLLVLYSNHFTWCNTLVRALPGALFKSWQERKSNRKCFSAVLVYCPFPIFSIAKGKLLTYMLPVMAPLALMMAKYAVDCVKIAI